MNVLLFPFYCLLPLPPLNTNNHASSSFFSSLFSLRLHLWSPRPHFPLPHPSHWENWPHKKWKGLFKRSGSLMKTDYCVTWCSWRRATSAQGVGRLFCYFSRRLFFICSHFLSSFFAPIFQFFHFLPVCRCRAALCRDSFQNTGPHHYSAALEPFKAPEWPACSPVHHCSSQLY